MKYSNLTASIPEELKEEVKERAKSEDLTISDIVTVALAKFLTNSDDDRNSKKSHTYIVGGFQSPSKSLKTATKINKKRVKHIALISNPSHFPQKPYDKVKDLIGRIPIDIPDLGRNHKRYISECFEENE